MVVVRQNIRTAKNIQQYAHNNAHSTNYYEQYKFYLFQQALDMNKHEYKFVANSTAQKYTKRNTIKMSQTAV